MGRWRSDKADAIQKLSLFRHQVDEKYGKFYLVLVSSQLIYVG